MKKAFLLFLIISLLLVSCGTTRFSFDRTERNIVELGGIYNKQTEEDIKKIYTEEGLDEVILEVYKGTFTALDVQGYLGEDIYKQYTKRVDEYLKEIEALRREEGMDALTGAVLDETYPEGMVIASLGGENTKLASDFKVKLEEKMGLRDTLRGILEEQGYEGIKNVLVNEEYDEDTIEEYLGKNTLDEAKTIYAKETGTDGFSPVSSASSTATKSNKTNIKFVSAESGTVEKEEDKKELALVQQIIIVASFIIVFYLIAVIIRAFNRRPLSFVIATVITLSITILSFLLAFLLFGWSIYYLAFLLLLPLYFILTAEMRN